MKFEEVVQQQLKLSREELLSEPHAFIDRKGWFVAPFSSAERLAKSLCEQFPQEILRYMKRTEDDVRRKMLAEENETNKSWSEERLDKCRTPRDLVSE